MTPSIGLNVEILGAGALGLAYGHLLTMQGHRVEHVSLSGRPLRPLTVRTHNTLALTESSYRPKTRPRDRSAKPVDVQILAVRHENPRQFCNDDDAERCPARFHFGSFYSPSELDANAILVYPVVSCEQISQNRLNIIAGASVDVFPPQRLPSHTASALPDLFNRLGLQASYFPDRSRLTVRYLQTAAFYIALRALKMSAVDQASVTGSLMSRLFLDLCLMADAEDAPAQFDSRLDHGTFLEFQASLIRRSDASQHHDLLAENVHYLRTEGHHKVQNHLLAVKEDWTAYTSSSLQSRSMTRSQRLISAVLEGL